ncbi:UvrD-helicase domain-containing protein [Streptacidiphilus fuscans]|uniref:DEAD/DEAH box helicase n=1 Tax=Streptacidiphilus fuscans TaxID=2789292 RepID=A0A931FG29_9ACTN|nr:UvrD-helicase domain-containing protein [Streptacidiphilus fuscans]MBF9069049.1 DEAD/DEAH box helicase [Streptacidiphilus fuscans]
MYDRRAQEQKLDRAYAAARRAVQSRWLSVAALEQSAVTQLLTLAGAQWHLLLERSWPARGGAALRADALLVGAGGVFVVAIGGKPDADGSQLHSVTRSVAKATGELGLAPVAVRALQICEAAEMNDAGEMVWRLDVRRFATALHAERRRLTSTQARLIVEQLSRAFPAHTSVPLSVDDAEDAGNTPETPDDDPGGLFDLGELRDRWMDGVLSAPIENWMTFLAQDQLALVRRNWQGPARISGPAGTGKTVVGLHRAAYLAQRTTSRVLFITYARNLPRVQSTFLHAMAPYVADRIDFRSLFGFAQEFLRHAGQTTHLNGDRARLMFNLAWAKVGRSGRLAELVPDPRYWQDEIEYVIKGRGITDFSAYAAVPRRGRGRGTVPQRTDREAVWELYEAYERLKAERTESVHDFPDVLVAARDAILRDPSLSQYSSVIVDETQDLPQVAVQFLHALVGDAPNGLLLIGDGQQSVYPGGFRLSDAGVDIRGDRGQVLRVNYRNAPEILAAALDVVADVAYEDLDDTVGRGQREVELVGHDGTVTVRRFSSLSEHDDALLHAVRTTPDQPGTAVLAPTRRAIERYAQLLRSRNIPVCLLEEYNGAAVDAVKIGSYTRAKGLDFKHVLLPCYDDSLVTSMNGSRADALDAALRERSDLARRQLFVAMTRARDTLWLGAVDRSATASGDPVALLGDRMT